MTHSLVAARGFCYDALAWLSNRIIALMRIAETFRSCPFWALLTLLLLVSGPIGATAIVPTGRANPFKPLIRSKGAITPQSMVLPGLPSLQAPRITEEPNFEEAPKLLGIISGPSGAIAAIKTNDRPIIFLKPQETRYDLTLLSLDRDHVVLSLRGRTYRLYLATQEKKR